jgi:hypothetical protein
MEAELEEAKKLNAAEGENGGEVRQNSERGYKNQKREHLVKDPNALRMGCIPWEALESQFQPRE